MVLHPEVQQKAFEEIRSVCGSDRLPSYELDRDSLPFVTATVMEIFRWALISPLGMYECISKMVTSVTKFDIIFQECHIGAQVMMYIMAMLYLQEQP
jgi:cytochrome P450